MKLLILIGLASIALILIVLFTFAFFAWSSRQTLLKNQTAWSAKGIGIIRKKSFKKTPKDNISNNDSFLQGISNQTDEFLKGETNNENDI